MIQRGIRSLFVLGVVVCLLVFAGPAGAVPNASCSLPRDDVCVHGWGTLNGWAEPGETVTFEIWVENPIGEPRVINVEVKVIPQNPEVTMGNPDTTDTIPALPEGPWFEQATPDITWDPCLVCEPCCPTCECPDFLIHYWDYDNVLDICQGNPGDGNIDPGDTIRMDLEIKNLGRGMATGVVGTLYALTPGVAVSPTLQTATFGLGGIVDDLDTALSQTPFEFSTDQSRVQCGDQLLFRLDIDTDQGPMPYEILVEDLFVANPCNPCNDPAPPDLVYRSATVVSDVCPFGGAGDGNGDPDPGETVAMNVEVENLGGDASAASATLVSLTPGVTVTTAGTTFGPVTGGGTATSRSPFEYTIDAVQVGCGDQLLFRLDFVTPEGIPPSDTVDDLFVPDPCALCTATVILDVDKAGRDVNGAPLVEGDTILYTLSVCNDIASPGNALDVLVRDPVPADTTYTAESIELDGAPKTDAPGDDEGEYDGANDEVLVTIPSLAPGACAAVTFEVTVDAGLAGGTRVSNLATAAENNGTGTPFFSNRVDMTVDAVVLTLAKTGQDVNGDVLLEGDTILYSLLVCNDPSSTLDAVDVLVRDPVPADTTYTAESIEMDGAPKTDAPGDDEAEYDGANDEVLVTIALLGPGECAVVTFEVTVDAGVAGGTQVTNQATAAPDNGAGTQVVSNRVDMTVEALVLTLSKTGEDVNGDVLLEDDTILYTLTVCNDITSPGTARDVLVRDPVPGDTTYTAETIELDGTPKTDAPGDDEAEYDGANDEVLVTIALLTPGECAVVTFEVTVDAGVAGGTQITNQATAAPDNGAGTQAVSNQVDMTVDALVLTLSKTGEDINGDVLLEGDIILYTLRVCNNASSTLDAMDILVRDPVPADTTYTAETIELDGAPKTDAPGDDEAEYDGANDEVIVTVPLLAPGECADITFEVTVDAGVAAGTDITNEASAAPDNGTGTQVQSNQSLLTVGESPIKVLRGEILRRNVPEAESCPNAVEQGPRLDLALDECPAPDPCTDVVPDQSWQVLGDALWGSGALIFYEVAGVPCIRVLDVSRDTASPDDLFLNLP